MTQVIHKEEVPYLERDAEKARGYSHIPTIPSKCPDPKVGTSLKENCTTVPIPALEPGLRDFAQGEREALKQEAPKFFQRNFTSFTTDYRKIQV